MSKGLTLAKILVINGIETLGSEFIEYYYPEVDMYIFWTECKFDPATKTHKGRLLLHDRLIADLDLPYIPDNKINFVNVDIRPSDQCHTYLTANSRYYRMTANQLQFLVDMFNVDFCKKLKEEKTRAF